MEQLQAKVHDNGSWRDNACAQLGVGEREKKTRSVGTRWEITRWVGRGSRRPGTIAADGGRVGVPAACHIRRHLMTVGRGADRWPKQCGRTEVVSDKWDTEAGAWSHLVGGVWL
jgi:hypothetical protein